VELHVVRHAVAFDKDPRVWPDDRLRPLTPEGEEAFGRAARGLRLLVPSVDILLSSPYVRSWRTAEILHEAGWPPPSRCPALEVDRPPSDAVPVLRTYAEERSVAIVGHEPHLGRLVSLLVTGDQDRIPLELAKGGAASLSRDGSVFPGGYSLVWVLTQELLVALRAA
jgi:phosphohistidine phosphatase